MQSANQPAPIEAGANQRELTWAGHVLIPVAQNLLGGAAVSGLVLIAYVTVLAWLNLAWSVYDAKLGCLLIGGLVTCVVTVVRFFGDDLGIVRAAYRAGQQSRDAQIAALQLELRATHDAQNAAEAGGGSPVRKRQELLQRARADCGRIVAVHFDGDAITRKAMAGRNMGQRDWERAMRLLMAAGVVDGDGVVVAKSPNQALKAVDERLATDTERGATFTPAWR